MVLPGHALEKYVFLELSPANTMQRYRFPTESADQPQTRHVFFERKRFEKAEAPWTGSSRGANTATRGSTQASDNNSGIRSEEDSVDGEVEEKEGAESEADEKDGAESQVEERGEDVPESEVEEKDGDGAESEVEEKDDDEESEVSDGERDLDVTNEEKGTELELSGDVAEEIKGNQSDSGSEYKPSSGTEESDEA